LPGKVASTGSIDKLILFDVIEITIDLCSNRLALVLSTCVSYTGYCMIGFNLPTNFVEDPEALLKRTKAKLKRVSTLESENNGIRRSLILEFEAMANKSLHEFSAPTTTNIYTRHEVNVGENRFELKPALINMVQASQFSTKAHEDASAHLQHFL
jgi:hypothetical protein